MVTIGTPANAAEIRASPANRRTRDVFISYSRRDKTFVASLDSAFRLLKRASWVDWDGVSNREDRWKAIQSGIEAADTFIFVISPDSVASSDCHAEIDYAVKHNKRILPIVRREGFDMQQVHPTLQNRNWFSFRESDDFDTAFRTLIRAIDTGLAHVHTHTHLLLSALEWERQGHDTHYLLQGSKFRAAERWLEDAEGKIPLPTPLHRQYIALSRAGLRRQRRVLGAIFSGFSLAAISALIALSQYHRAERLQVEAELQKKTDRVNRWLSSKPLDALVLAIATAGQSLDNLGSISSPIQLSLLRALQNTREQNQLMIAESLTNVAGGITAAAYSPTGQTVGGAESKELVATANNNGTVMLWDAQGTLLKTIQAHADRVRSVAFSPEGLIIATGSDDQTIRLWNLRGERLLTLAGHQAGIRSVAFSHKSQTIVSGSADGTLKRWDLQGHALSTFVGHRGWVNTVAFSPDDQRIASGSSDGTVRLWDLKGHPVGRPFQGHEGEVYAIAFSPDGRAIASGSEDATIRLWNLKGHLLMPPLQAGEAIYAIAFAPPFQMSNLDEQVIVSGGAAGVVQLWDRRGSLMGQTSTGQEDQLTSVVFSPDGRTIASTDARGTLRFWQRPELESFNLLKDACTQLQHHPLLTQPQPERSNPELRKMAQAAQQTCQTYGNGFHQ